MDQDTFADISTTVARLNADLSSARAELTSTRQDLAELATIVAGLCRNLSGKPSAETLHDWADIANTIQYGINGQTDPTDGLSTPDGLPVFLWTRWNFDQVPMADPTSDGFACYSAWLQWDDAAMPIMAFEDGDTYVCDREAARRDPDGIDAGTYWTGVPGHRRDHAMEEAAERAGWRRQSNEGETEETY